MRLGRFLVALTAMALLVPSVCACSVRPADEDAKVTLAYDGQYDSYEFSITPPTETEQYNYTETGVTFHNDNIYAFFSGYSQNDHTKTSTHLKIYDVNGDEKDIEISYPGETREDYIYKTYAIIPNDDGLSAVAYLEVKPINKQVYDLYTSVIDLETGKGSLLDKVDEIDGSVQYVSAVRKVGDYICIDYGYLTEGGTFDIAPSYLFYKDGKFVSSFDASEHKECSNAYYLDSMSAATDGKISMRFYTTAGYLSFDLDPITDVCDNFRNEIDNYDKLTCCKQYSQYLPDYGNNNYDNINILTDTDEMIVFLLKTSGFVSDDQRTVMVLQKTSGNPKLN